MTARQPPTFRSGSEVESADPCLKIRTAGQVVRRARSGRI